MAKIIECVPNFSEGRSKEVVESIVDEIRRIEGIKLLDCSMDEDHNRSVVTFIGAPREVQRAAISAAIKAAELIDMERHTGEHPRLGATDVIPFIPISESSIEECVEIAREVAREIAQRLSIPTFLYEAAATSPERKNLANIRKGQYEGMKTRIKEEGWEPDFGPREVHPKSGATVVGARMPLIAFNVNLGTPDINIAKKIAEVVREAGGGLKNVMAMGVMLKEKNIAQVSMNMINYRQTSLYRSYEMVKMEAKKYGVAVIASEIVGLTPVDALIDVAEYYLQLEGFSREQILESHLYE
ncbi:MAG: Glutamate formimidoyltransferase [Dehalococcoidia bacterium]|nr:Glutamate formimidoyltransferase [Chloroflexota bacterium]